MLREEGYKPRILAVDEFAIHQGHSYATCVMDLEQGDILWFGNGRAMKDFEKLFSDINGKAELILPEYKGPKAIGQIFGISYIYSIFWKFGLIRVPAKVQEKLMDIE